MLDPHRRDRTGAKAGPNKALALLRRLPRRSMAHASDLLRVLALLALRPAAYLPRRWAFATADAIGNLYLLSPVGVRARAAMAAAFPECDAKSAAREWIRRTGRDYVAMRRLLIGRDKVADRPVRSHNEPALLREPGQSVIIALGHFSREANIGLYKAGVVPKQVAATIAPLEKRTWRPRELRIELQITAIMNGIKAARGGNVEVVPFDGPSALMRLVKHLRRPDTAVTISTDAVIEGGRERGHERDFAGHRRQSFAFGTARLARLSQRPILPCVPYLDEHGELAIEWADPIMAPARDDESADIKITDAILDFFERAIGQRPGQYVLSIGHARRWDESSQSWVA
jgi:lauroyl/myristoyl acyltransferase